jgi:hypothetical protein
LIVVVSLNPEGTSIADGSRHNRAMLYNDVPIMSSRELLEGLKIARLKFP